MEDIIIEQYNRFETINKNDAMRMAELLSDNGYTVILQKDCEDCYILRFMHSEFDECSAEFVKL